jgi:hypothetical protein
MNQAARFLVVMGIAVMAATQGMAQKKYDEEKMMREIEVAESILTTLIKQQFDKRSFFPMEVRGEYREGYGVTFRLPYNLSTPFILSADNLRVLDGRAYSYSFGFSKEEEEMKKALEEEINAKQKADKALKPKEFAAVRVGRNDSMRTVATQKVIEACKEFMANYGELITQLKPDEKIIITNRGESERFWYGAFVDANRPVYLALEVLKADITDFQQGKINREALNKKIKVVNSVMDDELKPDLELFSSIFNRLYRPDLSKTFFTEQNVYYERMKDYGVIYYMQVYSSNSNSGSKREDFRYSMPTLGLDNLSQSERDKKVVELYPRFEKDIKEDMLEYGRTIKSLNPDEQLILNIKLTKCDGCGIPSSLELSVKADVLSSYASGKITKEQALAKISVKKGANQ